MICSLLNNLVAITDSNNMKTCPFQTAYLDMAAAILRSQCLVSYKLTVVLPPMEERSIESGPPLHTMQRVRMASPTHLLLESRGLRQRQRMLLSPGHPPL